MIEYILDTDICIYWLKGKEELRKKVEQIGTDNLKITIITLAELKYGAYNSQKVQENLQKIKNFLAKVKVLQLDNAAAKYFGKIKSELRKNGKLIEDFDILIGSIVLSHGGVLVTNNIEHFKRISGLNYENWIQI